jgi:cellulose synthase/poly-beta-1,6-N-acetylglucosamine synthase-like glycosyltransferase
MHTLLIFAFCNVDDLSWGTKGSDTNKVFKFLINIKIIKLI